MNARFLAEALLSDIKYVSSVMLDMCENFTEVLGSLYLMD